MKYDSVKYTRKDDNILSVDEVKETLRAFSISRLLQILEGLEHTEKDEAYTVGRKALVEVLKERGIIVQK